MQAVQPHLRKCFDNILKIEFAPGKNSKDITGMWSAELEFVAFSAIVKAEGNVEFWLRDIERMMIQSLKEVTCYRCIFFKIGLSMKGSHEEGTR